MKVPDDGSWTHDEMLDAARKITKKEQDIWGYWPAYGFPAQCELRTEPVDRWQLAQVIAWSVFGICLWGTLIGTLLPMPPCACPRTARHTDAPRRPAPIALPGSMPSRIL